MATSNSDGSEARQRSIIVCAVVGMVIAGIGVAARFYTRYYIKKIALGAEDWCLLIAWMLSVGNTITVTIEAETSLGRHIGTVTLDNLVAGGRAAFITIVMYIISLAFTKISILLLYIRVFSLQKIRFLAYGLLAVIIGYNTAGFIVNMTICVPVNKIWDPSVAGTCRVNNEAYTWVSIIQHVVTDFLIFLLPIWPVYQMNIPLRQKIGVCLVFAIGLLDCLISILRAFFIKQLLHSPDPTWDYVSIANWSSVELNLSILVACLIVLKPLVIKIWPRILTMQKLEDAEDGGIHSGAIGMARTDGKGRHGDNKRAPDSSLTSGSLAAD